MNKSTPLRVGVFDALPKADRAVKNLVDAGFDRDSITVVCSDEATRKFFGSYADQAPAGETTPARAAAGSAIGATLGGLAVVVGAATTGGATLMAAGALVPALAGGAVAGGFVGAMTSRGVERELADHYDQAVEDGKILVAAETTGDGAAKAAAAAERVLSEAGAEPIALPEG